MWIDLIQSPTEMVDLAIDLFELQIILIAIVVHKFLVILLDHLIMKVVILNLS